MKAGIFTIILLVISNIFMTFSWYVNLKLKELNISKEDAIITVVEKGKKGGNEK